jgi:hypothetical protein
VGRGHLTRVARTASRVGSPPLAPKATVGGGRLRLGSFIGLGLLPLVAAAVWQRMRPRPLPDLRDVPPAVR